VISNNNGLILSNNNSTKKYHSANNQPDTSTNNLYIINSEHRDVSEKKPIVENDIFNILNNA